MVCLNVKVKQVNFWKKTGEYLHDLGQAPRGHKVPWTRYCHCCDVVYRNEIPHLGEKEGCENEKAPRVGLFSISERQPTETCDNLQKGTKPLRAETLWCVSHVEEAHHALALCGRCRISSWGWPNEVEVMLNKSEWPARGQRAWAHAGLTGRRAVSLGCRPHGHTWTTTPQRPSSVWVVAALSLPFLARVPIWPYALFCFIQNMKDCLITI